MKSVTDTGFHESLQFLNQAFNFEIFTIRDPSRLCKYSKDLYTKLEIASVHGNWQLLHFDYKSRHTMVEGRQGSRSIIRTFDYELRTLRG